MGRFDLMSMKDTQWRQLTKSCKYFDDILIVFLSYSSDYKKILATIFNIILIKDDLKSIY